VFYVAWRTHTQRANRVVNMGLPGNAYAFAKKLGANCVGVAIVLVLCNIFAAAAGSASGDWFVEGCQVADLQHTTRVSPALFWGIVPFLSLGCSIPHPFLALFVSGVVAVPGFNWWEAHAVNGTAFGDFVVANANGTANGTTGGDWFGHLDDDSGSVDVFAAFCVVFVSALFLGLSSASSRRWGAFVEFVMRCAVAALCVTVSFALLATPEQRNPFLAAAMGIALYFTPSFFLTTARTLGCKPTSWVALVAEVANTTDGSDDDADDYKPSLLFFRIYYAALATSALVAGVFDDGIGIHIAVSSVVSIFLGEMECYDCGTAAGEERLAQCYARTFPIHMYALAILAAVAGTINIAPPADLEASFCYKMGGATAKNTMTALMGGVFIACFYVRDRRFRKSGEGTQGIGSRRYAFGVI